MAAYEILLLNTAIPQIQAAQSGDTYVVPRDIAFSAALTLSAGTANGVPYLNGSKVLTTGSALTFDGTNLLQATGGAAAVFRVGSTVSSGRASTINLGNNAGVARATIALDAGTELMTIGPEGNFPVMFQVNGNEQMRLTTTGLGIGTNNPTQKLTVNGVVASIGPATALTASSAFFDYNSTLNLGRFAAVGNTTGTAAPIYFSQYSSNASVGRDAMIIDSSGNLGLGVTPSAWTAYKVLQINTGSYASSGNNAFVGSNWFYDGADKYIASDYATLYRQYLGAHAWFTAPSGTANSTTIVSGNQYTIVTAGGNFTTFGAANNNVGTVFTATSSGTASGGAATQSIVFSQAMTLDASGNLGVGVTSTTYPFDVNGTSSTAANSSATGSSTRLRNIYTRSRSNSAGISGDLYADQLFHVSGGANFEIYNADNFALVFGTNATERARITSGGDLYVGTQTALNGTARLDVSALTGNNVAITAKNDAGANQWLIQAWNAGTSGDNAFVQFATETAYTGRGSITYNRTAGLVAYNTTSDYRAKDILGPVANSGATIDALKVYEGKMKGATQSRPMLVAHEAQEHAPYAVTGEKDGVNEDGTPKYQQMDVSSLVPLLLAEIQSLRARVAQLEQGA